MPRINFIRRVTSFGLLISSLSLVGFGCNFEPPSLSSLINKNPPAEEQEEVPVERADLRVAAGQSFTIEFEGNETTGYRWTEDHSRPNIEFVKDEYVPHEWAIPPDTEEGAAPTGIVGAGGTHFFTFSAVRPGSSQIRFEYSRPWEDNPPLKVIVYDIKAE